VPLEQRDAERRFQLPDLLRERRLRDALLFGPARERTGAGHRTEVPQLVKFHFSPGGLRPAGLRRSPLKPQEIFEIATKLYKKAK
jgi:hypothetical protein